MGDESEQTRARPESAWVRVRRLVYTIVSIPAALAFPVMILVLVQRADGRVGARGLPEWFSGPITAVIDWIGSLLN